MNGQQTEVIDGVTVQTNHDMVQGGELAPSAMSPRQQALVNQITPATLDQRVAEAQAFIGYMNKIRMLAIKATAPQDWVMMGDKPWLQETGVKKINQILGIRIYDVSISSERITDETGREDIYYTASGTGELLGRTTTNVGMSSTRDEFFAQRTRWVNTANGKEKEKYLLTIAEIDLPSVRKKAVTNLQARIQRDLCPINPTHDELKEAFGDRAGGIKGFRYGSGSQGGGQGAKPANKDNGKNAAVRDQLVQNLGQLSGLTHTPIADILVPITKMFSKYDNFRGWGDPNQVQPWMLEKVAAEVEKRLQDTTGGADGLPPQKKGAAQAPRQQGGRGRSGYDPQDGPDDGPPVRQGPPMITDDDLPD